MFTRWARISSVDFSLFHSYCNFILMPYTYCWPMILQTVLIILSPYYVLQLSVVPYYRRISLFTATTIHSDLEVMNLFTVFRCRLLEHQEHCCCCYLWDSSRVVMQCPMGKLMYVFVRVDNIVNYYSRLNPLPQPFNPLTSNDLQRRPAVSHLKIKIPSKKSRQAALHGGI
jgi:hypothetical protein